MTSPPGKFGLKNPRGISHNISHRTSYKNPFYKNIPPNWGEKYLLPKTAFDLPQRVPPY